MILYLYLFIFVSTDVYYYLKDPPPEFLPRFGTITMAGLLGMFLARKGNRTWCNHKHATGFTVSAALGSESLFKCGSSLWFSWRLFRSHSLHMCLNNSLHLMNLVIWSKQLSIHRFNISPRTHCTLEILLTLSVSELLSFLDHPMKWSVKSIVIKFALCEMDLHWLLIDRHWSCIARLSFQENGCPAGPDECSSLSLLPSSGRGRGKGNLFKC